MFSFFYFYLIGCAVLVEGSVCIMVVFVYYCRFFFEEFTLLGKIYYFKVLITDLKNFLNLRNLFLKLKQFSNCGTFCLSVTE
jgi:hypothetical protein